MKKTYKLLNIEFDGIPLKKCLPKVEIDNNKYICALGERHNIYDLINCERVINATSLFNTNWNMIREKLLYNNDCSRLYIRIDYMPKLDISNLIFCKRLLQIMNIIKKDFIGEIVFLINEADYKLLLNNFNIIIH